MARQQVTLVLAHATKGPGRWFSVKSPHLVSAVDWCTFHPCYRDHSIVQTVKNHLEMASASPEKPPTALILIADGSEEIEFVTPYE